MRKQARWEYGRDDMVTVVGDRELAAARLAAAKPMARCPPIQAVRAAEVGERNKLFPILFGAFLMRVGEILRQLFPTRTDIRRRRAAAPQPDRILDSRRFDPQSGEPMFDTGRVKTTGEFRSVFGFADLCVGRQ